MQPTPWWASFIVGAFAFIGVLLAQSVALYIDRRRVVREEHTRWHAERRLLYARLAQNLRENLQSIGVLSRAGADPEDAWQRIDTEEMNKNFEEIQLLGSQRVIDAAALAIASLAMSSSGEIATEEDYFERLRRGAEAARIKFVEAARQELGITKPEKRYVVSSDSVIGLMAQVLKSLQVAAMSVIGIEENRRKT